MRNVVILLPTYSGVPSAETAESIRSLGANIPLLKLPNCSDVSLARSRLFTKAVELLRSEPRFDVVLCVDDDMVFGPVEAQTVITLARERQCGVSAVYTAAAGFVCATPMPGVAGRYLTGLGFLAVPVPLLLNLADRLAPVRGPLGELLPFATSGPRYDLDPPQWEPEDFSFTRRIGGVHLAPVAVGHCKKVPLWPDDETLARVQAGLLDAPEPANTEPLSSRATPREFQSPVEKAS